MSCVSRINESENKMKHNQEAAESNNLQYLHDTETVLALRNQFMEMIAQGGSPVMCKIKVWAQLKNAIIREAFAKAHLPIPEFVLESFGERK